MFTGASAEAEGGSSTLTRLDVCHCATRGVRSRGHVMQCSSHKPPVPHFRCQGVGAAKLRSWLRPPRTVCLICVPHLFLLSTRLGAPSSVSSVKPITRLASGTSLPRPFLPLRSRGRLQLRTDCLPLVTKTIPAFLLPEENKPSVISDWFTSYN